MEFMHAIERVLLIDDDDDDRFLFKQVVHEINTEITVGCADSCINVMPLIAEFKPQLIFMDINMPALNGHGCLRTLKDSIHHLIPVVMYSSSFYSKDINISYGLGANLYFSKPNKLDDLKSALTHILSMKWQDPEDITAQFFKEGKYYPYLAG